MHDDASGGRTKQLDIFCRVTGFTSDFLSFIDVELIRFFHGALQLSVIIISQENFQNCTVDKETNKQTISHVRNIKNYTARSTQHLRQRTLCWVELLHCSVSPGSVGFIAAKDDEGDNWRYKMCKATVKSSTNQHPSF